MKRSCEICKSRSTQLLHCQKFIVPTNKSSFSYEVVACKTCGFVFASNLPSTKDFESLYQKSLKYTYKTSRGKVSLALGQVHHSEFKLADSYLQKVVGFEKKSFKILDIGCATGHLLSLFRKRGYRDLTGIDPVPACRLLAKKLYNIKVVSATLSSYQTEEKYDLVILTSVLEHLTNLNQVIAKVTSLLKINGFLLISVPDGEKFSQYLREPFLEFSLEHINYFTFASLNNLLCLYGLRKLSFESIYFKSFGSYILNTLWQYDGLKKDINFDPVGQLKIKKYINRSLTKLNQIEKRIRPLIDSRQEIIVWGVGSLTARLLATTNLRRVNIKAFVDNNPSLQGKKINGVKILSPQILKNHKTTVFISTYNFGPEIKKILLNQYHYPGKIILI